MDLEIRRPGSARLPPILARLLRGLGWVAYAVATFAIFGLVAYVSFSVFVRGGVTSVPSLSGLGRVEAERTLLAQGLRPRHDPAADRYDDQVPAGSVLDHKPGARALVKRGSEVVIALSRGPRLVAVPDLIGGTLQSAKVTLAAEGLAVGRILNVLSDRGAPGTVVEQVPPAGSAVAPMASVDLMVCAESTAEVYLMPDLIYRRYDEVKRFFDQRGFRIGSVKFEPYEGLAAGGVILRQFPPAGHPLRRQDALSLVVAASLPEGERP